MQRLGDLSPKSIIRSRHSDFTDKMNRSAYEFKSGERGGSLTGSIFTERNRLSKCSQNLLSRSWMRSDTCSCSAVTHRHRYR